jgi:hypothetical protein
MRTADSEIESEEMDLFTQAIELKGNKEDELSNWATLICDYPSSDYYVQLLQIYRDAGNLDQSIKILVKSCRREGRTHDLSRALAYTYKLAGKYMKPSKSSKTVKKNLMQLVQVTFCIPRGSQSFLKSMS